MEKLYHTNLRADADNNGSTVTSKYYDLGTDVSNIDKVEDPVLSILGGLMTDVTQHILNIEQDSFF